MKMGFTLSIYKVVQIELKIVPSFSYHPVVLISVWFQHCFLSNSIEIDRYSRWSFTIMFILYIFISYAQNSQMLRYSWLSRILQYFCKSIVYFYQLHVTFSLYLTVIIDCFFLCNLIWPFIIFFKYFFSIPKSNFALKDSLWGKLLDRAWQCNTKVN